MTGIWLGLWSLLSGGRQRPRHSPGTSRKRWRPQLETLEDRLVPATALAPVLEGVAGVTVLPRGGHLFVPKVFDFHGGTVFSQLIHKERLEASLVLAVADLSNVTFTLLADDGRMHQLTIHNQVYAKNGSATFDGLWDQQQRSDGGGAPVFGQLALDGRLGTRITFTWTGNHFLVGHVTVQGVFWHLDGVGMSPNGGPGHVAGNGI
jgi:hypothetical protein